MTTSSINYKQLLVATVIFKTFIKFSRKSGNDSGISCLHWPKHGLLSVKNVYDCWTDVMVSEIIFLLYQISMHKIMPFSKI